MSCEILFHLESKTMHGHTWFKHINTLPDRSMQTNNKYRLLSIHACDTLKHNRNHMKRNVFHMCDLPCQGFQMLEFFAGRGVLSQCMRSSGYTVASFDIIYSSGRQESHGSNFMDLNSSSGFAYSVIEIHRKHTMIHVVVMLGPKKKLFQFDICAIQSCSLCIPLYMVYPFEIWFCMHGYDWMFFFGRCMDD